MKKLILLSLLFLSLTTITYAQTLHLYGGKNHDVYLGCLNCDKYNSNSIWNTYGNFGSKYNANSIWNAYGTYGSKYNALSPWNAYSSDSPVVVDKQGNFYGYFTVNSTRTKRANFNLALIIYEYHELIMKDVAEWYDKIF